MSPQTRPAASSTASSTVKPPPPADATLSRIENSLLLTPLAELGPHIYTNAQPLWQPAGARGIYGGSVIAQSLMAAQMTVPAALAPHSMHCFFVLAGNSHLPVVYHVDLVRSGRSFHTRTVQARQRGRCIFTATVSFTQPLELYDDSKPVTTHQRGFCAEDVAPPEQCESEEEQMRRLLAAGRMSEEDAARFRAYKERDPLEWRRVKVSYPENTPPAEKVVKCWARAKEPVRDPKMQSPALAYLSDSWFIGTVGRVNPQAKVGEVGMLVSLDHTIHFHADWRTRCEEWLFVEMNSPWAGEERGLVQGRIYARDGTLLASIEQEGLIRLKDGRQGEEEMPAPESKL